MRAFIRYTVAAAAGLFALAAGPGTPDQPGAMRVGAAAERAGDSAAAEAAYRQAWENPADRDAAAKALRGLYTGEHDGPAVDQAALAAARTELGPDFLLNETRNFVILSDADQAWTRQRSAMLERARHQYFRVMDRLEAPVYPHRHKLFCILFKDFERYRAFARAEDGRWADWVAGYYSPRTNRIVFYNDTTSPAFDEATAAIDQAAQKVRELRAQAGTARRGGQTQYAAALDASAAELEGRVKSERGRLTQTTKATSAAKTVHEAIHLLAFNTGLQRSDRDYPFWLTEGLATCFETDNPSGGAFGPDHPNALRREGFSEAKKTGKLMPLDRLVGLTEVPREGGEDESGQELAQVMYNQSQTLFAHLYRYRRKELAGFLQAILAEPAETLGAERHRALFEGAFGDPAALERRLKAN